MVAAVDERRHDLDALRAFAMLLGIVLHAALAFVPGGWAVQDTQPSNALSVIFSAIHGFRMPLFFVVSGFFTMMLLRKRGTLGLLKQRSIRIALPLLLGVATIVPAVNYLVKWSLRLPREPVPSGIIIIPLPDTGWVRAYHKLLYSSTFNIDLGWWKAQAFSTPVFHHLWFLWFLIWLTPALVLAVWLWRQYRLGRPPAWLVVSPASLLWLLPLTFATVWFMGFPFRPIGPDTSVGLLPMPHVLAYYTIFFGFGALCYVSDPLPGRLGRHWWLWSALAIACLVPMVLKVQQDRLLSSALQVGFTWTSVFALMGLFARFVRTPNRVIRYLSDASYWLYLMHMPVLFPIQAWLRTWEVPGLLKCAIECALVTGVLLIIYELAVRYTWVGAMLNGRKRRPQRVPAPAAVPA